MQERMQAAAFDAAHLSPMPTFDGAVDPDDLNVLVKKTPHRRKRIHRGFSFLIWPV